MPINWYSFAHYKTDTLKSKSLKDCAVQKQKIPENTERNTVSILQSSLKQGHKNKEKYP